jgi:hypothetical protein
VILAGEDREHPIEFLESGVGAADDHVQVAAAPSQAGAQLVDNDRQPLARGQPVDVVEQVDIDGAVGVLHRQQSLPGAFLAARHRAQRRRQRGAFHTRLCGQAVDELLADQCLGAHRAAGVGAKVLEAGVVDVQNDGRLRLRRRGDRAHRPHLDPVDLDVLAGDDVARVVEDRAHGVATA